MENISHLISVNCILVRKHCTKTSTGDPLSGADDYAKWDDILCCSTIHCGLFVGVDDGNGVA